MITDIQIQRNNERNKYVWIKQTNKSYADGSHGMDIIPYISKLNPKSLVDVGTGNGEFCVVLSEHVSSNINIYGVDFVFDGNEKPHKENVKFIMAYAHILPFPNNSIDILTSFDMLEHILPSDIDLVLNEFNRIVQRKFIFSICYRESECFKNELGSLHPTVRNESWWINKLSKYGKINKLNKYIEVTLC